MPRTGCSVVSLALELAVFVIARDFKLFVCFTANEKENYESFAEILLCCWDQGVIKNSARSSVGKRED
ncbi:hypothetical protein K1719_022585 [Acacia pycnantha]|nr:hypothetical protein K1719_022585 [Acacia pycnantha]